MLFLRLGVHLSLLLSGTDWREGTVLGEETGSLACGALGKQQVGNVEVCLHCHNMAGYSNQTIQFVKRFHVLMKAVKASVI